MKSSVIGDVSRDSTSSHSHLWQEMRSANEKFRFRILSPDGRIRLRPTAVYRYASNRTLANWSRSLLNRKLGQRDRFLPNFTLGLRERGLLNCTVGHSDRTWPEQGFRSGEKRISCRIIGNTKQDQSRHHGTSFLKLTAEHKNASALGPGRRRE